MLAKHGPVFTSRLLSKLISINTIYLENPYFNIIIKNKVTEQIVLILVNEMGESVR